MFDTEPGFLGDSRQCDMPTCYDLASHWARVRNRGTDKWGAPFPVWLCERHWSMAAGFADMGILKVLAEGAIS